MSPYMLGSYYRFEFPTVLSLSFRMTGIFMSLVLTPLACLWMLMFALGEERFAAMQAFMGSWLGVIIGWVSALVISYHLFGGIRHLLWDSGRFMSKPQIRSTGWAVVVATLVLWITTLWVAS
jgi:succinate dehydrogenase / fumarate reductase cytochrome b subunit